ncbi:MAG: carboxypeptidase-like regulatory domain-containing protein, partial [Saprospiraceae bacterium]
MRLLLFGNPLPILFLCAAAIPAQQITGTISGLVADPSGAAVTNVKVTVLNTGTNVANTVTTGDSGSYRVPFLIIGKYRVTAEAGGFKTSNVENVNLSASEEVRVDINLTVGQITDKVTVTESAISLKSEEATVSTTLGREQIIDLPLPGRQIIAATLLAPGAYSVNNNSKAQRDSGFV